MLQRSMAEALYENHTNNFILRFIAGKYLSLVMLCFVSILVPSFISGFMYVTFLCCVTYWACDKNLGRNFAYLCRFLCIIIFFYIVAIFCYQTEWVQEQLPPDSDIPKYILYFQFLLSDRSWLFDHMKYVFIFILHILTETLDSKPYG